MILFSYYHILERISRLERGMVNIHDQMKIGFAHISSELRSLSSSVQPWPRISNPTRRIDNRFNENDDYDDYNDADNDQEEVIEEINPVYEDFYSEGKNEHEDSKLQEEAQKQLVKRKRKEIRVYFVNLSLCLRNLDIKFNWIYCFIIYNLYFIERNKNLITKCDIRTISDRLYEEI